MAKRLTDKGVDALARRAARYVVSDPELRGHYLRVPPSGPKVFAAVARGPYGKGTATQSRIVEVWLEVRRLHDVEGRPLDEGTFEDVGKKLGVGRKSTVSRLYWLFDRVVREFEKAEKSGHVLLPRLRSHRPKSSA